VSYQPTRDIAHRLCNTVSTLLFRNQDQKPFQGKRSNPPSQPGSPRPHNSNATSSASSKGVSGWIRKHIGRDRGDRDRDRGTGERDHQTTEAAEIEVAEVGESSEYSLTDYEMESTGDLA